MILLIDNYDSFVYNLARYLVEMGCVAQVVRNDAITVDEVRALRPEAIVLSPGPCTPREAGVSVDVVRTFSGTMPILGVCLGHQAIGAAFGANVVRAPEPVHGRTAFVHHDEAGVFAGLPNPLQATRYHSLVVDEATVPPVLRVTARTEDGVVMGLRHATHPTIGLQFHPESVLTQSGPAVLARFLALAGLAAAPAGPGDTAQPAAPQRLRPADVRPPLHW